MIIKIHSVNKLGLTALDPWAAISLPFFAPHAFTVRHTLGCFRLSLQIYQLAFRVDKKLLSRINSVSCNGPGRKRSFTHIEHRAGAVSWECLVQEKIAVPTLLPSKWVRALAPSYLLQRQPKRVFTLHQSMAKNLSVMRRSIFEIGDAQLHSGTEISPKSLNPARFSWRRKSYPILYEHTATATRTGKKQ